MEKNEKKKYTLESKSSAFDRNRKTRLENAKGNNYLVEFAHRLCLCLDNKNENESELARETKIGKASINAYVKAEQIPSIDKLIIIAKHFNVSTDYLLGLTDLPNVNEDFKTVHKITGLSENSIELLQYYNNLIKDKKIPQIAIEDVRRSYKAIDFLIQSEDITGLFSHIASYLWDTYQNNTEQIKDLEKYANKDLEKMLGNRIVLKTTDNRNVNLKTSDINKIHLISIEEILYDLKQSKEN